MPRRSTDKTDKTSAVPPRISHRPNDQPVRETAQRDTYSTSEGRTAPPGVIPTEEERLRQRLSQRADELRGGHWRVRRCERGHVIESHRTNSNAEEEAVRCPICGGTARREAPEATAMREHQEATTPFRMVQNLMDTISEWATDHLHASHWTQRSEQSRAARLNEEQGRAGGYGAHDI